MAMRQEIRSTRHNAVIHRAAFPKPQGRHGVDITARLARGVDRAQEEDYRFADDTLGGVC